MLWGVRWLSWVSLVLVCSGSAGWQKCLDGKRWVLARLSGRWEQHRGAGTQAVRTPFVPCPVHLRIMVPHQPLETPPKNCPLPSCQAQQSHLTHLRLWVGTESISRELALHTRDGLQSPRMAHQILQGDCCRSLRWGEKHFLSLARKYGDSLRDFPDMGAPQ